MDELQTLNAKENKTEDDEIVQFTKGAPDMLLKKCNTAIVDGKEKTYSKAE